MNIVARAKNILFSPKSEWPVAAAEPASTGQLMTYAAILSAISAICQFIGTYLTLQAAATVAPGMPAMSANTLMVQSFVGWLLGLGVIYLMSIIAAALAGSFNGTKDNQQALKLLVYAGTATWVAGFFAIIPILGWIVMLVGYAYAIYLIYLGAPHTVRVPEGKNGGYAAVVVVIWLVLIFALSFLISTALTPTLTGIPTTGAGTPSTF